jgi:hypothetical protein
LTIFAAVISNIVKVQSLLAMIIVGLLVVAVTLELVDDC